MSRIYAFLAAISLLATLALTCPEARSTVSPDNLSYGAVTNTQVSVDTSPVLVIARNPARARLMIQNTSGSSTVRLKLGSTFGEGNAQSMQEGWSAAPGYIMDLAIKDAVYAKSTGASTVLNVIELVR